jgi:hypothetical protein
MCRFVHKKTNALAELGSTTHHAAGGGWSHLLLMHKREHSHYNSKGTRSYNYKVETLRRQST